VDSRIGIWLVVPILLVVPAAGQQEENQVTESSQEAGSVEASRQGPAYRLLSTLTDTELRDLVTDALERNPEVALMLAKARAMELRTSQVRALPDPVAAATAWVDGAQTRTGPQVLTLSWTQALPWLSKLDLSEQAVLLEAGAMRFEAEAKRLELVTSVRRLYYELGFLVQQREVAEDFLDHLRQHEAISRSRYATGVGASQDVVKIQAEITRAENLRLDIDQLRIGLEQELNHLRDRSASTLILPATLPQSKEIHADFRTLLELAGKARPEVRAADARIAASEARIKLAEKNRRPDFSVGLTYTFVDRRDDEAGIVNPPEGNGDDILGIQGGIRIPLWRQKLRSGVEESEQLALSSREDRRRVMADIEASLGDLLRRIPLNWQQLHLLEDILLVQARESVQSAQSKYVSGTFNALDLLDAEHVLFDAETAIARARADYAIRLAQLEGAVAAPLTEADTTELSDS